MAQLSPECYYDEIQASADALAAIVAVQDPALPIPTCPEWTLRQLGTHVGRAHRWAAEIVRRRASEPIGFREAPDGAYPAQADERAAWLRHGARLLIETVTAAGDDVVWASTLSGSAPAGFWARRMAHETLVHRVDAEFGCGTEPVIDPVLAADAIDEWLTLLSQPMVAAVAPLPAGAVLHVHATDPELAGDGEWLVRHVEEGLTVEPGHGKADIALSGPAANMLLLLVRRRKSDDHGVTVHGDASLLTGWLENTPF
jgi:uncharacterized protein (TIGR03083 family)